MFFTFRYFLILYLLSVGIPVGSVRVSTSSSSTDVVAQCNDMVKACSRAYDGGFGRGSCTAMLNSDNSPLNVPDTAVRPSPVISDAGKPSDVLFPICGASKGISCTDDPPPCRYFDIHLLSVGVPCWDNQGQQIIKQ